MYIECYTGIQLCCALFGDHNSSTPAYLHKALISRIILGGAQVTTCGTRDQT